MFGLSIPLPVILIISLSRTEHLCSFFPLCGSSACWSDSALVYESYIVILRVLWCLWSFITWLNWQWVCRWCVYGTHCGLVEPVFVSLLGSISVSHQTSHSSIESICVQLRCHKYNRFLEDPSVWTSTSSLMKSQGPN